jgi:DNA-binding NtrC family response regulator
VTGIVLRVPALAERRSDIPVLAQAYVRAHGLPEIDAEALRLLECHAWPGNVRELQRALVRATHHSGNGKIAAAAVRSALAEPEGRPQSTEPPSLAQAKWRHVHDTVAACGGDTGRAAVLLGVSRSHLYRLLRHESH